MSITDKGVVREVNGLLADYRIKRAPVHIELGGRDVYRANYAATVLHGDVRDPVMRGIRIGLGVFSTMRDFSARYYHADVRPMYKLSTQESAKRIGEYRLNVPERAPNTTKAIRFTPEAAVSVLAAHGLWLASHDAARRRDIPDALEKRLAASAENPEGHLKIAVSAAIEEAADLAASVKTFEADNGIHGRGRNVAGYAIYGYSGGEYGRVSTFVDVSEVGRY